MIVKVEIAVYSAAAQGPVPQELLHPDGRKMTQQYRATLERRQDKLEDDEVAIPRNSPARKSVTSDAFRLMLIDLAEQQVRRCSEPGSLAIARCRVTAPNMPGVFLFVLATAQQVMQM